MTSFEDAKRILGVVIKTTDASQKESCFSEDETFGVLRTSEYIRARELVKNKDDYSSEDIAAALKVMDDPKIDYWKLSNRLEEMGRVGSDLLNAAYASLPPGGEVCVYDDIYLVEERVAQTSNSFMMSGCWAVQKSKTGKDIRCAKMWDPVLIFDELDCPSFKLINLA